MRQPADAPAGYLSPVLIQGAHDTAVSGWGGGPGVPVHLFRPGSVEALRDVVLHDHTAAIARGMGRSYGDAAQLRHGTVLETTGLRGFEFDAEQGILTAQSGVTLDTLLDALAPAGWTLPVLTGTEHVSVGGAIASDVHGKNHGVAGTFGAHVLELGLLTADGDLRTLSPHDGSELFGATIGGMGLTGVIVWARIKLAPLRGRSMGVDTNAVETLDEALSLLAADDGLSHRIAWLDLLSRRPVRGIVTRAAPLPEAQGPNSGPSRLTVRARASVPEWWPGGLLRPGTVRAFNELRFRLASRHRQGRVESHGAHTFPLDVLDAWPALYGRRGFVQYQPVVPRGQERVLEQMISLLRRSRVPCFLATLKELGPENPAAPLSFPLEGWTIALDLPRAAPGLDALLCGFDLLVAEAGGRIYLTKDARVRPNMLAAMYPRLEEWREVRDLADPDGRWRSDLGVRTGLVEATG
jgi:decaprenylphospho-beta-D-ribofuranose 2-oxidase